MKNVEQKVIKFIDQNNLISDGDKILVAFSGGPDSLFALNFLYKFRRKYKIEITAVHFNHGLRGKESDADERFAKEFCGRIGVRFISKKLDVKAFAKKNKFSIEEAARILRYKNLDSIALKNGCGKIVTAHNLTDNTETVLMNLFTGTGLSGLTGIPVKRERIIRPLLSLRKEEIVKSLEKEGVCFRVDSTNLKDDFRRNFIRNQILPLVRSGLNPKIDEAVFRSSVNLSGVLKLNVKLADYLITQFVKSSDESSVINLELCNLFEGNLPGEILKKVLKKNFNHQFEHDDFLKINSLLKAQKGRKVQLSKKLSVFREGENILIKKADGISEKRFRLSGGEKISIGSLNVGIELTDKNSVQYGKTGKVEFIDAGRLGKEFILRRWKEGDKFKPLGMKCSKKVSDFLTDSKIPTSLRENQFVLVNRNQIVWVVGLRIDERVKLNSKTNKVYKLWVN